MISSSTFKQTLETKSKAQKNETNEKNEKKGGGSTIDHLPKKNNVKNKNKNKHFLIMCWNKGNASFANRKDEVNVIIERWKPKIFGLLEANIEPSCHANSLNIDGYSIERDNLADEYLKSRAAVMICNSVNYRRRRDLEPSCSPAIWLEINPKTAKACLVFIGYREWRQLQAKNKKLNESMKQQLLRLESWAESWNKASNEGKSIIVLGDFNIDISTWVNPDIIPTLYQKQKKSLLDKLKEMAAEINLNVIKTRATRVQGNNFPSYLDLIMTNKQEIIENPILINSPSDHKIICFNMVNKAKQSGPDLKVGRSFKLYSKEKMLNVLNIPRLNELLFSADTNEVAEIIVSEINKALDHVAPIKKVQIRKNYAAYLSSDTKSRMLNRDNLKEKANTTNDEEDKRIYRVERNKVLKAQRFEKKKWAEKMILGEASNGAKIWKATKTINGDNKNLGITKLTVNGIRITNPSEIANSINDFFIEKIKKIVKERPPQTQNVAKELEETKPSDKISSFRLMELEMEELNTYIKEMKKTTAAGMDTINGIVLNDVYPSIKQVILHMINLSLSSKIYPNIFKTSKIIPIPKMGKNKDEPEGYRPVNNLSQLGKLIERASFDQVMAHVKKNNLTNKDQHGGRKAHSTTTCVAELTEGSRLALEAGQKVAWLALDLSAAYDLCDHRILLAKCKQLNLDQHTLDWIKSFLEDRYQCVVVNGFKSVIKKSNQIGVIQGGRSSGELFTIYLNNLPEQVNGGKAQTSQEDSTCKEYIDDATILVRAPTVEQLIKKVEQEFITMQRYLQNHLMMINKEKTQIMFINPTKELSNRTIWADTAPIKHQKHLKLLGIHVSQDLSFDYHIWEGPQSIIRAVNKKAGMIRNLKGLIPQKALQQVGNNLVNSTLLYCAPIWGATKQGNIERVQKAQTKAARTVCTKRQKGKPQTHRQDMLNLMNWPNVSQIVMSSTLNLMKRAIMGNSSEGMTKSFKVTKPNHPRSTKQTRISHNGPLSRSTNNFTANACMLYKNLPPDMKDLNMTCKSFKNKLKVYSRSQNLP